jgi:hypothetical protein
MQKNLVAKGQNDIEKQIALPDTYLSFDNLKNILDNQGIEINRRNKLLGLNVQDIRLIDVFLLGPFLIYVGMKKELSLPIRLALLGFGAATIIYNGNNYLKNKI